MHVLAFVFEDVNNGQTLDGTVIVHGKNGPAESEIAKLKGKSFDLIYFAGGHGDVGSSSGKPTLFNSMPANQAKTLTANLQKNGIKTRYVVADCCFSIAFASEFWDIMSDDGGFAGWVSNGPVNRFELVKSYCPAELPNGAVFLLLAGQEATFEGRTEEELTRNADGDVIARRYAPNPVKGSGQGYFSKKNRKLIRYTHQAAANALAELALADDIEAEERDDIAADTRLQGRVLPNVAKMLKPLKPALSKQDWEGVLLFFPKMVDQCIYCGDRATFLTNQAKELNINLPVPPPEPWQDKSWQGGPPVGRVF